MISRGAMGVGAALLLPTGVAIITNMFSDPRERARALGVWASVAGLGQALGPLVGGIVLSTFWWGSVFLVNVPIVIAAVILGARTIPESRRSSASHADPAGIALSILSVAALLTAAIRAPFVGWLSLETIVSFVIAVALLVLFVGWERRRAEPMLRLSFFRRQRFAVAIIAATLASFSFAATLFVLTQLLQLVATYSPLEAGVALAPLAGGSIVAGLLGPRVAERIGTSRTLAVGFGLFACGLVLIIVLHGRAPSGFVVASTLLIGAGFGTTTAPNTDAVVGAVSADYAGEASGVLSTMRQLGQALGVAIIGSVLVSGYRAQLSGHLDHAVVARGRPGDPLASLDSALSVAQRVGGNAGAALAESARSAFTHGMRIGFGLTALILLAGAVISSRYMPNAAATGSAGSARPRSAPPQDEATHL
jgi:MFS family permease